MIYFLYPIFAFLWWKGGEKGYVRDIFVPILCGTALFVKYHTWHADHIFMAFLTMGTFQIIRMGYGAYDPENDDKPSFLASLTHDRLGAINRGIYGLIVGLVGLSPYLYFTGNLFNYFLYTGVLSVTGFLVVQFRLNRFWTDIQIGLAVGNVILL